MIGRYLALIALLGVIALSCPVADAQQTQSTKAGGGPDSSGESGPDEAAARVERAPASPAFAVAWWSIDNGGGTAAAGSLAVSGVTGQPDAVVMAGSGYTLEGGFVPVYRSIYLFTDTFESGDTSRWTSTSG